MNIKIDNWSVCCDNFDPYMAPEQIISSLHGTVYNHPLHTNGKEICTTSIKEVNGRMVTTKSGTVYVLGKIDKNYRKFLKKHYPHWNYKKPISLKNV
jgi:hypothetical protein